MGLMSTSVTRRRVITASPVILASCLSLLCGAATLRSARTTTPAYAEPAKVGAAETQALTTAQQQYDKAKKDLESIGGQLEQTSYQLSQTESDFKKLGVDITSTQNEIMDKETQLDSAQKALSAYLVINYKSGTTSMLDLLMSSSDFNDFVTRTYYVTKVQNAQVDTINEIKQLKSDLEDVRSTLTSQQDEEAKLKSTLESTQKQLTDQQKKANDLVNSLSDEVKALFDQQQQVLTAAAQARATAKSAAEGGAALGVSAPSVSQGSIVEDAYACLGIPYVWGGDDENFAQVGGFDCSGFVQHCYALEGYTITRTTWDQIAEIQQLGNWKESIDELQPGDLLFPNDGHVGIYIGNNQYINAPYPGMFIEVDDVPDFIGGGSPV